LFLARRVAFHLVFVDLADGKILRLGVGEVPAADRGCRENGVMLGEEYRAVARFVELGDRVEQFKQGFFRGVVRAGWVAGGRADALVGFFNQFCRVDNVYLSTSFCDRQLRVDSGGPTTAAAGSVYTSVCSDISKASSTSIPRYLTVLSSFE
jgi:hypothetical protein